MSLRSLLVLLACLLAAAIVAAVPVEARRASPSSLGASSASPPGAAATAAVESFWCRFIDAETGEPVPGVEAHTPEPFIDTELLAIEGRPLAVSTQDGLLRLDGSIPSGQAFDAHAEGYGMQRLRHVFGHAERGSAFVVTLQRSASLELELRNVTGEPAAHERVRVACRARSVMRPPQVARGNPGNWVWWLGTCDEEGVLRLDGLPPNVELVATLTAQRPGLLERFKLEPASVRRLSWWLSGPGRIEGVLVDQSGKPIAAREVVVVGPEFLGEDWARTARNLSLPPGRIAAETTTDAKGRFRLLAVPPGEYLIGPLGAVNGLHGRRVNDNVAPIGVPVVLKGMTPDLYQRLVVARGLYVEGRVLDGKGEPLADIFAFADCATGGDGDRSDLQGHVRIGPVAARPHRVRTVRDRVLGASQPLLVEPGGAPIELTVTTRSAKIAGWASDAASEAAVVARFVVWNEPNPLNSWSEVEDLSTFSADALSPGVHTVVAMTEDDRVGYARTPEIAPGQTIEDVAVKVARGAYLVLEFGGAGRRLDYELRAGEALLGRFPAQPFVERAHLVPAEEITVRWFHEGTEVARETVQAVAGESHAISL